jgi:hypothetical protein
MTNAELVEYAKNQLNAGSSANYIRTVLIKQGWGERDVDDAIGIAQSEAGSSGATAAARPLDRTAMRPVTPSGKSKSLAIAGVLTGIFFIIMAAIALYMLITIGGALSIMDTAIAQMGGIISGLFSGYLWLGWIITIIELLAGIFWIIAGAKELRK